LIIWDSLAAEQRLRVQEALTLQACPSLAWHPGTPFSARDRPTVIIAGLAEGERHLPPVLGELAEHQLPEAALLVICSEPLTSPFFHFASGRLILVSGDGDAALIASQLHLARHRQTQPSATTTVANEWRDGPIWMARLGSAINPERTASNGVRIVLAEDTGIHHAISRDLSPLMGAWRNQRHAEQTPFPPHHDWLAAGLTHQAERWTFAGHGLRHLALLVSADRAPGRWQFQPTDTHRVRVLDAADGDVLVISSPLPADPALMPDQLARIALEGGPAVMSHLDHHSRRLGFRPHVVVTEVRA